MWLYSLSVLLLVQGMTLCAQQNVRNPFACSHKHNSLEQPQSASVMQAAQEKIITESHAGWHVIEQRGSKLIMQHTDGSIREVSFGK